MLQVVIYTLDDFTLKRSAAKLTVLVKESEELRPDYTDSSFGGVFQMAQN